MSGTTSIPRRKKLPALQIPTSEISDLRVQSCLQMVQTVPSLFISSYEPATNFEALTTRGITHILNLANPDKCPNLFEGHFEYLSMHLSDSPGADIWKEFDLALLFIDRAVNAGGKVLVHCLQGRSRAPTLACAYLIWKFGLAAASALDFVRKVQPEIDPNLGFVSQLETLSLSVQEKKKEISLGSLDSCLVIE